MKNLSIKVKIAIWLMLLMMLMAGLLLGFMLLISNSVLYQTAMSSLSDSVRNSLGQIHMEDGVLL